MFNLNSNIMKVTIVEAPYKNLNMKDNCVSFNSDRLTQDKLAPIGKGVSGILTLELNMYNTHEIIVVKFNYSTLGDDGAIEWITGEYGDHSLMIKKLIVAYALGM
jgi:hypothetical protein